jgi:hypothetical protein
MKSRLRFIVPVLLTACALISESAIATNALDSDRASRSDLPRAGIVNSLDVPGQRLIDSMEQMGTRHVDSPWVAIKVKERRRSSHMHLLSGPKRFLASMHSVVEEASKAGRFGFRFPGSRRDPNWTPGNLQIVESREAHGTTVPSAASSTVVP